MVSEEFRAGELGNREFEGVQQAPMPLPRAKFCSLKVDCFTRADCLGSPGVRELTERRRIQAYTPLCQRLRERRSAEREQA